jgi:hypothetical protein
MGLAQGIFKDVSGVMTQSDSEQDIADIRLHNYPPFLH